MKKHFFWSFLRLLSLVPLTATFATACSSCGDSGADAAGGRPEAQYRAATPVAMAAAISRQGRLYTTACQVHKVVLFTDESQFRSPLIDVSIPGDRKIAVPIDVTVKGYVDFSDFGADNVEIHDSLCRITLPDPRVEVTAARIDHAAVRQYVSMTRSNFSDADINRLAAQGKDTIASHLLSYGIVERSRESCVRNLTAILRQMGYQDANVVIRFRKDFTNQDLRSLTTLQ